jgi:hypothetical protein
MNTLAPVQRALRAALAETEGRRQNVEASEAFEWIVREAWSADPTMPDGMDEKAALVREALAEAAKSEVCNYPDCKCPIDKGEVCAAGKAKADRRKPCTCHDTSRGPGRPCAVKSGNALGELWRCVEESEAPKAEPVTLPRVYGVGRDAEYPRALLVDFDRVPTDDELRALHELVRSPPAPQPVELSDAEIIAIRDEHLPAQGEPFDCIAFARAVLAQGRKG